MKKLINNELHPKKNEFGEIICECCGTFIVSDDDEIAEQGLCDHCHREVNDYEIVGWRKGE